MKALSLTQPWATLIAVGAKRMETRIWGTSYRGPLAIHASKRMSADDRALAESQPFKTALDAHGGAGVPLPLGCIVAVVNLVDCRRFDGHLPPEPEASFGWYKMGRWCWMLSDAEPTLLYPATGRLGLWEWEPPR